MFPLFFSFLSWPYASRFQPSPGWSHEFLKRANIIIPSCRFNPYETMRHNLLVISRAIANVHARLSVTWTVDADLTNIFSFSFFPFFFFYSSPSFVRETHCARNLTSSDRNETTQSSFVKRVSRRAIALCAKHHSNDRRNKRNDAICVANVERYKR